MTTADTFKGKINLCLPVHYTVLQKYLVSITGMNQTYQNTWYVGSEAKAGFINQSFGQNLADFYKNLGLAGHDGIDWYAREGTCIYAMFDGEVIGINDPIGDNRYDTNNWGHVTIQHKQGEVYFRTIYGHISDALVKVGQRVWANQLLALSGNTGQYTTGAHLHTYFFETDQMGNRKYTNNGYRGGLDHSMLFVEPLYATHTDGLLKLYEYAKAHGISYFGWGGPERFKVAQAQLGFSGYTLSQYYDYRWFGR